MAGRFCFLLIFDPTFLRVLYLLVLGLAVSLFGHIRLHSLTLLCIDIPPAFVAVGFYDFFLYFYRPDIAVATAASHQDWRNNH